MDAHNKFINKCLLKYGNKFDYSLTRYINSKTKVKIICTKHGEFEEKAFQLIKHKDEIKNFYCDKNNISLIRISYKDEQNVENILKKYLLS